MRLAIVGSRGYLRLDEVKHYVWEQDRSTVILSGGAKGVDEAAVSEARRLGMAYEVYLPEWGKHGRSAGAIRNREIVDRADAVVAFWDGSSKGTQITMRLAQEQGKLRQVFTGGSKP